METQEEKQPTGKMLQTGYALPEHWIDNVCKWFKLKPEQVKRFDQSFAYDDYMDKECIDICNAMNQLPGIETFESCCGHGKKEYRIWFKANDEAGLFFLARCKDNRYWEYGTNWRIEISVGDVERNHYLPTLYLLTSVGVNGEDAYKQITSLIDNMNYHLNHKNFIDLFDIRWKIRKEH